MYYWNFCFTLYSMNHTCSFKFMTTSMIKGMDSVTPHRNARSSFKLVKILIISLILLRMHTYLYIRIYKYTRVYIGMHMRTQTKSFKLL